MIQVITVTFNALRIHPENSCYRQLSKKSLQPDPPSEKREILWVFFKTSQKMSFSAGERSTAKNMFHLVSHPLWEISFQPFRRCLEILCSLKKNWGGTPIFPIFFGTKQFRPKNLQPPKRPTASGGFRPGPWRVDLGAVSSRPAASCEGL